MRVESSVTSVSWIPSEAVTGAGPEGHVRLRDHQLRRPPARRHRRPRASGGPTGGSASPTGSRRGPRSSTARIVDAGCSGGGLMGSTTVRLAKLRATFEPVAAPRPPPRAHPLRHRGHVRADHGRAHRPARAPAGEAPAVRAVPRAHGVDDARAHHPRRRHVELRGARREQVPAPLGLRRRPARSRPRSASPTSRSGTATRSASTRRGATRTRRRWSPRSRPRSSASSRSRSCRAASAPRSAPSRRASTSSSRATRATRSSSSSTACCR